MTADHCRAMAQEAERLAAIVSYARDKERLAVQARSWRERAEALDLVAPEPPQPMRAPFLGWLRRRPA